VALEQSMALGRSGVNHIATTIHVVVADVAKGARVERYVTLG